MSENYYYKLLVTAALMNRNAGRDRYRYRISDSLLTQVTAALTGRSLLYKTAGFLRRTHKDIMIFTPPSYQYVRSPQLLKKRASRPTAVPSVDAITVQLYFSS